MPEDEADTFGSALDSYDAQFAHRDVMVYRISGAFFFGATAAVSSVLDRIGEHPRIFILDFSDVRLVDSPAARMLEVFVLKLQHSGTRVYFVGASKNVRRALLMTGLRKPLVRYAN